jgi:hypothetical protein
MDMSGPNCLLSGHVHPAGAMGRGVGAIAWTSVLCPCPSVGRSATIRSHWTVWTPVVRSRSDRESMWRVVDRAWA